ncbi:MAG: tetratricopeptide repeat protein [Thermoanaerobaculia bacterium]|nr:tetratricopeptide repeat protein [Thermoanaerobaculia bacterium]
MREREVRLGLSTRTTAESLIAANLEPGGTLQAEDELLAARAAERARADGSSLLLARALFFEGEALRRLNRLDEAEAALAAAGDIFEDGGFSRSQGDVLTTLGNVKWDRQDLAAALTYYEAAARLYGSINNERLRNRTLSNQALVLQQRGEFQAALETYQTVRASLDAAGDLPAEAITLVAIGEIYVRLGRFADADATLNEASDVADQSGLPVAISSALSASGEFLMLEGNLPEAERKLREALAIQEEGGDLQYAAEARIVLASVRYYQGDLQEAERSRSRRSTASRRRATRSPTPGCVWRWARSGARWGARRRRWRRSRRLWRSRTSSATCARRTPGSRSVSCCSKTDNPPRRSRWRAKRSKTSPAAEKSRWPRRPAVCWRRATWRWVTSMPPRDSSPRGVSSSRASKARS